MSLKDFILLILSYCGLKIVDKLVEDNLPNLYYKNLINGYYNYVVPFILTSYMGFIYLQLKISTDKQEQKNLENTLILIAAAIIIQQALKNNKLLNKKIPATHGE